MALTEDFLELMRDAQTAIEALLDESRPDAFIELRRGYGEIDKEFRNDERRDELEEARKELKEIRENLKSSRSNDPHAYGSEAWKADQAARQAKWARQAEWKNENWSALRWAERRHRVLNILGDDQKTIAQIIAALHDSWVKPDDSNEIYYSDMAPLIKDLTTAGELIKVPAPPHGNQKRWAYKRNRSVSPELAAIERSLADGEVA